MKTYTQACRERAEEAQALAVERHYGLEAGCDAWLELKKMDEQMRDLVVPELCRRLEYAIEVLRSVNTESGHGCDDVADELERL